jgi:hypothetical protein
VYGICRDAFVNSAAQIAVNLNKMPPRTAVVGWSVPRELDKRRRGLGLITAGKASCGGWWLCVFSREGANIAPHEDWHWDGRPNYKSQPNWMM